MLDIGGAFYNIMLDSGAKARLIIPEAMHEPIRQELWPLSIGIFRMVWRIDRHHCTSNNPDNQECSVMEPAIGLHRQRSIGTMIRVICHTGWERAGTCQGQADGAGKTVS
jgi:hypothetical protein